MTNQIPECLEPGFSFEARTTGAFPGVVGSWTVTCRACDGQWVLKVKWREPIRVGVVLSLLNHEASHKR